MKSILCFLALVVASSATPTSYKLAQRAATYALKHPNPHVEECHVLTVDGKEYHEVNELNADRDAQPWPNGILLYEINEAVFTTTQIQQIEAGINDLVTSTEVNGQPCIQIIKRTIQQDFCMVEKGAGCSSYIGRIGGQQRISLEDGCVSRHGTIMHEFLHALGFHHEQKRTDRDDYITIDWSNIEPGYEDNFFKMGPLEIDLLGTSYDYGSVMHYGAYAFAVDDTKPTIIPTDPTAEIGQRLALSALDIERVQVHYGCLNPKDSVYFKHLAK